MSIEFRQKVSELLPHKLKEPDNATNLKKLLNIYSDFIEVDRDSNISYGNLISIKDIDGASLDLYGDMFGCYREPNENDEDFRVRIRLALVLRKTGNTIPEIQSVITQFVPNGNVIIRENHLDRPASCYLTGNTTTDIFEYIFGFVRDLLPAGVKLFVPVALLGTWRDLMNASQTWGNVNTDRYIW